MKAIVLNAGSDITGSSVTNPVGWTGGKGVFIINASQYAGLVSVQMQGPSGAWTTLNPGAPFTADSAISYDLPAGQYRLLSTQGSSLAVYSKIVAI